MESNQIQTAGRGQIDVSANLPKWAAWLPFSLQYDLRYIVLFGGRAGAKSESVSRSLVLQGTQRQIRVLCCREVQDSIADSSKGSLETAIKDLGLSSFYTVTQGSIIGANGTRFIFRGLSKITQSSLRSLVGVDIAWVEEGQDIKEESWRFLTPTIRKKNSQIWVTFNPTRPTDIVYKMFVSAAELPPRTKVKNVNFYDNPFVTEETLEEAEYDKKNQPEIYRHTWLGELMPDLGVLRVLMMRDLEKCVELYDKYKHLAEGQRAYVGLDVADQGQDKNALAVRRGPCLVELESWHGAETLEPTARRADNKAVKTGAHRLYYDESGIGVGVRDHLSRFARDEGRRPYYIMPVKFGEAPQGPDRKYDSRLSNKDMFMRRNAQLAWAVKQRTQNTARLANGEPVDPMSCLFINPAILDAIGTRNVLEQLNQPVWDDGDGGKIKIDKKPDDAASPDMYDAVELAFAEDSRNGLRQTRSVRSAS